MRGTMFQKVLVANRGEIAVRIIRALRELGVRVVAVYSEVDREGLPVRLADEAYCLGPASPLESYLAIDKVIEVCRTCGAEAIHPGYGFLAENPIFFQKCARAGITLIGPNARAVQIMGSKISARQAAEAMGVPVVPGATTRLTNEEEIAGKADDIGYPVLLKADAGGGGKGMRIVGGPEEIRGAVRAVRSEALSSFGDDALYLEKYLIRPRHIEIQVLGDQHGNLIHLGERECSIQRRHQKVIEESPSPFVDSNLRMAMGNAAVLAARAIGYDSAGTVEFLVDQERRFYFLEMNTRLQVEHPVTEMVTGIDIVHEMIRSAAGEPLRISQSDVAWRGAAIECRIYAEDPENNFLPSPGVIRVLRSPGGPGVRDDSGVVEGSEVSVYYDPIISKLVAWGQDRSQAIARMIRALREYTVVGIKTTLPFHRWVMEQPAFLRGEVDTSFIDREWSGLPKDLLQGELKAAVIAVALAEKERATGGNSRPDPDRAQSEESPWKIEGRRRQLHSKL